MFTAISERYHLTDLQGKFMGNPFLTPRSTSALVNAIPDKYMPWGQEFYASRP